MGGGGAPALDVAEDGLSHFKAGGFLNFSGDDGAHPAQLHVAEGVELIGGKHLLGLTGAEEHRGPFAHHDHREGLASGLTAFDHLAQILDGQGELGDEDGVSSPGHPAHKGDPAGMAAHDLHHHHPVVGFGCRM